MRLERLIPQDGLRHLLGRLCVATGVGCALVSIDDSEVLEDMSPLPADTAEAQRSFVRSWVKAGQFLRQPPQKETKALLLACGSGLACLVAPVMVADVHWASLVLGPFSPESKELLLHFWSESIPLVDQAKEGCPGDGCPCLDERHLQFAVAHLELTAELIGEKGAHCLKEQASRQQLEQNEETLSGLFQAVPMGLAITKARRLVAVNQQFCEICGYVPAELLHRTTRFLYRHEEEYRRVGDALAQQLARNAKTVSLETRLLRRDGSEREVALFFAPLVPGKPEAGLASAIQDISERKRVDNELRRNQETLQGFFKAMPLGLSLLKDRRLHLVNERLAEITGRTVAELTNIPARCLYASDEEYVRVGHLMYDRLWRDGKSYVETRFVRPDGSCREVAFFSAPIDMNDPGAGVAGAVEDITERKAVEAALRESERRYRSLFESSGNAILLFMDHVIIDCNQKALEMFRGSRNTLVGRTPWDISAPVQPDGQSSMEKGRQILAQVQHQQTYQYEWLQRRLDHTEFPAEVNLSAVELAGEPCLMAIVRDITDHKAAEKALQESEARFRAFYHTNPESVLLIDFAFTILDVNRAFLGESGYTLDECIGKEVRTFLPAADFDRIVAAIDLLKVGVSHRDPLAFSYLTKGGDLLPVTARGWVVTDETNNPLYLGVFIRNLSTEKALAEEKAALEKQVIQAQKSEAIGTLAGGIAHDFNNILGGVMGYLELGLLQAPQETAQGPQRYLQRALEGCNRAKELVRQILRFSRHSALGMEPINLSPLIKESIRLLRSALPANIVIRRHITGDRDCILGDATQMHQVIMNLCTNAYHAMRETGGTITLRLEPVQLSEPRAHLTMRVEPGNYLRLSVTDTGTGIPDDVLERMFEPYYTTKGVNEGTGLGLAVTMGIIRNHHGLIEVETALGRGTCFRVYLPATTDEARPQPTKSDDLPHGRGQRLLLVDDEAYFLEVVRDSLNLLAYQVIACGSSLQALDLIRADPDGFDLVITDQTMPEMTGTQLVREIRAAGGRQPVILCTGFSATINQDNIGAHGIARLLLKPVTIDELARAVREVLAPEPSATGAGHAS